MTKQQKQTLKAKIIEDIKALQKEIAALNVRVMPIAPDCSLGCLIREELLNDQEIDKKTLYNAIQREKKLSFALSKIDDEEYGVCLECGEDILFERLMLLPESLYCVDCLSHI